ncbi:hypothetical protein [Paenibacillus campi]|uniref:hypothetical protein n=1 Tax=Paenibacillus campi TaxID=3106031 RepID=UPI002AFFFB63|nr:hypothetical protein [Paenibacillus sp. SGZ-1014]
MTEYERIIDLFDSYHQFFHRSNGWRVTYNEHTSGSAQSIGSLHCIPLLYQKTTTDRIGSRNRQLIVYSSTHPSALSSL